MSVAASTATAAGVLYDVIVMGGGLAGMVAAISAAASTNASKILLLEKESTLGGNSVKASSGMNACYTEAQQRIGSNDSLDLFEHDVKVSSDGLGDPILIQQLVHSSKESVEWLYEKYGIRLDNVGLMGGHSHPRTHHQGPDILVNERPTNVGFYICSTLRSAVEREPKIHVSLKSRVTDISLDESNNKVRVSASTGDDDERVTHSFRGKSLVISSGGYAADRAGLLRHHHETAATLPTTAGSFSVGDGVRLGQQIRASMVHLDKVQIHPTGFVDPANPSAGTKFLAPERLRGSGGILVHQDGRRFVNELDRRDLVTDAVFQHCQQQIYHDADDDCKQTEAFLILNEKAKESFGPNFGFYLFKGFFKSFQGVREVEEALGLPKDSFQTTIEEYATAATANQGDAFGKQVFPVVFDVKDTFYVARITPAVHYTMGGLEFNKDANVLSDNGTKISGVFAAGEVTGGLHGENRLGGNSLLECVVYGRIAGKNAAQYASTCEEAAAKK